MAFFIASQGTLKSTHRMNSLFSVSPRPAAWTAPVKRTDSIMKAAVNAAFFRQNNRILLRLG
jgi:hypothetical protein